MGASAYDYTVDFIYLEQRLKLMQFAFFANEFHQLKQDYIVCITSTFKVSKDWFLILKSLISGHRTMHSQLLSGIMK